MAIEAKKPSKITRGQGISAQIAFRHSPSIREKIIELAIQQNLSEADMSRQLINEGLKSAYNVKVQGNQVVN